MSIAIASKWNGYSFKAPPEGSHTKLIVSCTANRKYSLGYGSAGSKSGDDYNNVKLRNTPFVTVDWGDGTVEKVSDRSTGHFHYYPTSVTGDYDVDISDGLVQLGFGEWSSSHAAGIKRVVSVGLHVERLSRYAFAQRELTDLSGLRSSNIREFGNQAFCYASGAALADLSWMPPITKIGSGCFWVSSLASLSGFPSSIGSEISESEVFSNTRITTVSGLPSTITKLTGAWMFRGCSSLLNCTGLPSGLTELGDYAFQSCSSMTHIGVLPSGLTYIPMYCFNGNPLLDTSGCENILGVGSYAFYNCKKLGSVSMPLCRGVDSHSFQGCALLESVSLPAVRMIFGYAFREDPVLAGDLSFPEAFVIGDYAFYGCQAVTSVSAPKLNYLGAYAFSGTAASSAATAMAITTLNIDDIRFIYGAYVFRNCQYLKTVYMRHRSVGQVLGTWGYSCNVTRDVTNTYYDFPWRLPKGCKIYCRNGSIEMTSASGSSPTYRISRTSSDGYSRAYDGVVTIVVRVDEPGQTMTLHMADATNGFFSRTDVYVRKQGGGTSSTSFSQSSGVFTYTFDSAGTYELEFDDFLANVDFRNLGVALVEISSMGPMFSMCEGSLKESDELERVVCWGSTGRNYSRFLEYEFTAEGRKETMRGARHDVVFDCTNGTLNGDCEEELYEWYLRQRYV